MKKALLILMTLLLTVTLISPVFAAGEGEAVGYSESRIEVVDTTAMIDILEFNEYPDETSYKITTAAGLKFLSDGVMNNYMYLDGVTVYLANDIDMTGVTDFQPIGNDIAKINGNPTKAFKGTFDGQGHTIENLVMTSTAVNASDFTMVGLFGATFNATVKNLIIGKNCSFTYAIPFSGGNHPCVSAFIVKACGNTVIENCWNRASINGGRFSAGFVARGATNLTIKNCTNSGKVEGFEQGGAGFVAYVGGSSSKYINCYNTGDIIGSSAKQTIAGGIVGRQRECTSVFTACVNSGAVSGYNYIGGIAGWIEELYVTTDCVNYGTVTATKTAPNYSGQLWGQRDYSGADSVDTGNLEKAGETDPNQLPADKTLDFTPNVGNPAYPGQDTTTEEITTTAPAGDDETTAPEKETTAKPADKETTAEKTTETSGAGTDDKAESGCSSAVAGSFAILAVAGAAIALTRKKKH